MNGLFIVLIFAVLLYSIYSKFKIKIYGDDVYKIGVLGNDKNIIKYGSMIQNLSKENLEIVSFEDYDSLMAAVNNKISIMV